MQDDRAVTSDSDDVLVAFSAQLAAAAYSVALRHGAVGSWLDLEMDLWKTLAETVERWGNRSLVSATGASGIGGCGSLGP